MDSIETETIPEADLHERFGHYQDEAIKRPVLISRDGRPRTVLLSYETFLRLRQGGRRVYGLDDLPAPLADALLDAEVPDDMEDGHDRPAPR